MIEWPAHLREGPFVIGILGESDIQNELEAYTRDKTLDSRNIQIERYESPGDVNGCHVLFIPFSQTRLIYEVITCLGDNSALLITERAGALKAGSAVNFILTGEKMKFEISAENAERQGLKINTHLSELAANN